MSKIIQAALYFVFVAVAVAVGPHEQLLDFSGGVGLAKGVVLAIYLGFLAYSLYCHRREDLMRTLGSVFGFHWGRQLGLDLYIGLAMFMALIYLNEGSWLVMALWALPMLLFVNLASLVYLLIHFEQIVGRFT